MANELLIPYATTGLATVKAVIQHLTDWTYVKASDGSVLSFADSNLTAAQIAASDAGHLGLYVASIPAGIADGDYAYWGYDTASATPTRTVSMTPGIFRVVSGVVASTAANVEAIKARTDRMVNHH